MYSKTELKLETCGFRGMIYCKIINGIQPKQDILTKDWLVLN